MKGVGMKDVDMKGADMKTEAAMGTEQASTEARRRNGSGDGP
jgi:hypothetical protein